MQLSRTSYEAERKRKERSLSFNRRDFMRASCAVPALGAAYFGESMFALEPDASKVAFAALVARLKEWEFHFIDAQVHTAHLERFGARLIPRDEYLQRLEIALQVPTRRGPWGGD